MSWLNGLLVGFGQGLQKGSDSYFAARDRQRQQDLQTQELVDARSERVRRGMLEHDEFEERKRQNRAQEALSRDENVGRSLDRMVARENSRYATDQGSQRAIDVALIRAEQARDHEAAVTNRAGMPKVPKPTAANPDGMTATQREGLMLLKRVYTNPREKSEFEDAWRKARQAFPKAHPGDVAVAAQRYLDRLARDQQNRY